jgi:hypothetical protein
LSKHWFPKGDSSGLDENLLETLMPPRHGGKKILSGNLVSVNTSSKYLTMRRDRYNKCSTIPPWQQIAIKGMNSYPWRWQEIVASNMHLKRLIARKREDMCNAVDLTIGKSYKKT